MIVLIKYPSSARQSLDYICMFQERSKTLVSVLGKKKKSRTK